ncbi:MAG: DNA-3-methyladenine glycosylase I [Calditrichia bacterium]
MSGKERCKWCQGDALLEEYHDFEWGIAPENDDELFERMAMQIFQAGLNWKLILQKRENFNKAFCGFSIEQVSEFDDTILARLLTDSGIIRNRQKIRAVLHNARVIRQIQQDFGSFRFYVDQLPNTLSELQKEFRQRFQFMGPEIVRMFVFNIGKIPPPHEKQCWRYEGSEMKRKTG